MVGWFWRRTCNSEVPDSSPPGEGSRDGAVVRALASHQCGSGSIPGLGVGSRPCSARFFSGYSGFALSSKTKHFQIPIRCGI